MSPIIVNADDFGLHQDIDKGILQCIEHGAVNSVSVVPNSVAVDWGLVKDLQAKGIKIGLHLTLVGEEWGSNPVIVDSWLPFALKIFFIRKKWHARIRKELKWQLAQFKQHGIELDHIDSHQHIHVLPGLWSLIYELQIQFPNIRIRVPYVTKFRLMKTNFSGLVLQFLSLMRKREYRSALPCIGLKHSGNYTAKQFKDELK